MSESMSIKDGNFTRANISFIFETNLIKKSILYKYDLRVKHEWTKNRHSPGIKTPRGCLGLNWKLLNATSFTIK